MLFLPILHPLRDSCAIGFNVVILLAIEFNHNLLVERFAGFFQQNPENLGVQILLEFLFVVASAYTRLELEMRIL